MDKKLYKDYFKIDPKYFPQVTEALIKQGKVSWKNYFANDSFIQVLKQTCDMVNGRLADAAENGVLKTLAAMIFCIASSVWALVRPSFGLAMVMSLVLPAAFLNTNCRDFSMIFVSFTW